MDDNPKSTMFKGHIFPNSHTSWNLDTKQLQQKVSQVSQDGVVAGV
jgi:hypothetical protein